MKHTIDMHTTTEGKLRAFIYILPMVLVLILQVWYTDIKIDLLKTRSESQCTTLGYTPLNCNIRDDHRLDYLRNER